MRCCTWRYLVPRLLIVAIVITSITLVIVYPSEIQDGIDNYCVWMKANQELGPFLLSFACVIATPLAVPGALMTIGTGFILYTVYEQVWKSVLVGTLTVFLGTWIGSGIAFLVGRYVLRDMTTSLIRRFKIMTALD